jgi:hypothetical protein
LPDDGFSLKPKHVARSKIDMNFVMPDGLYFPLTVRTSQSDVIDKDEIMAYLVRL